MLMPLPARDLSHFVWLQKYARKNAFGLRETYHEAVDRYLEFIYAEALGARSFEFTDKLKASLRNSLRDKRILPSMRLMRSAGLMAKRNNIAGYNCAFHRIDSPVAIGEVLAILMHGCGSGVSVEKRFIAKIPTPIFTSVKTEHTIPDSTEGWIEAVHLCILNAFLGVQVVFDYSLVRPEGAPLVTKGGTASGPEPLKRLLDFIWATVSTAAKEGRQLRDHEWADLVCMCGQITRVGGHRRSAIMILTDVESEAMRNYKAGRRNIDWPEFRERANISSAWRQAEKPPKELFDAEFAALIASGTGERGWMNFGPDHPTRGVLGTNPCAEILLASYEETFANEELEDLLWDNSHLPEAAYFDADSLQDFLDNCDGGGQFCNLSSAVIRAGMSFDELKDAVRDATTIGVVQSLLTDFGEVLRPGWKKLCERDRLIGVNLSGHVNMKLTDAQYQELNAICQATAYEVADWLGINRPVAGCTGKPDGNTGALLVSASGMHAYHAEYSIVRVRAEAINPVSKVLIEAGVPRLPESEADVGKPDHEVKSWAFEFPLRAPEGAVHQGVETALDQLDRYKLITDNYLKQPFAHSQSATISVRKPEWPAVQAWVYEHFDSVRGLSFLEEFEALEKYWAIPRETITREEYEARVAAWPEISWEDLAVYEMASPRDFSEASQTLACVAGGCELQ
jgi:ribonucleoside-triphosphate reductase